MPSLWSTKWSGAYNQLLRDDSCSHSSRSAFLEQTYCRGAQNKVVVVPVTKLFIFIHYYVPVSSHLCCTLNKATTQWKERGSKTSLQLPGKADPQPVPLPLAPAASQHMMAEALHWDGLNLGSPAETGQAWVRDTTRQGALLAPRSADCSCFYPSSAQPHLINDLVFNCNLWQSFPFMDRRQCSSLLGLTMWDCQPRMQNLERWKVTSKVSCWEHPRSHLTTLQSHWHRKGVRLYGAIDVRIEKNLLWAHKCLQWHSTESLHPHGSHCTVKTTHFGEGAAEKLHIHASASGPQQGSASWFIQAQSQGPSMDLLLGWKASAFCHVCTCNCPSNK